MKARMSNLGLHHDASSSNLSSEMMAMTRALFSSLETRVARLEGSGSLKSDSDNALQNRLTSIEIRLERQLKQVEDASSDTRESQESRLVLAEKELGDRLAKLEQQGGFEERMSRIEEAVASLNDSKLEFNTDARHACNCQEADGELRALYEENLFARLERRLDEKLEERIGGNATSAPVITASGNATARAEGNSSMANMFDHVAWLASYGSGGMPEKAAEPLSFPRTPPDESVFPQRCLIVLKDHRSHTLRRGNGGKLIAPHPKSPACRQSVPEQLLFCFNKKHGAFLIHSPNDGKRLVLAKDGFLRLDDSKSALPTSRELFFVIPEKGYLLIGCFHTNSYVFTQDELCYSKRMGIESIFEKAKFRISRRVLPAKWGSDD